MSGAGGEGSGDDDGDCGAVSAGQVRQEPLGQRSSSQAVRSGSGGGGSGANPLCSGTAMVAFTGQAAAVARNTVAGAGGCCAGSCAYKSNRIAGLQ